MHQIFIGFFRKIPKYIWVLLIIVFIGIFFRVYHFTDWLLFKGDAFRDAIVVSNAYRVGVESLPLLGPRAGGTMLHLGPIFYDFQYLAATLFQSVSAPVLAYPDLFFSILTIPAFFLFLRRYFSSYWSLAMTAMLAVSFLAIEYGRFAWNPNSALFFTLVFSYAVQRVYDGNSSLEKRPWRWAFVAGIALAVASQLHFSSFLGLPMVLLGFILWRFNDSKKILSRKIITLFFLGVCIIYIPVFFSEYFKHGENTAQFFSAVSNKSSTQGITQNVILAAIMFAKYFLRIGLGIVESGRALIGLAGVFCISGFLANVFLLREEKEQTKRNFLQWTLILITVFFLLYIPLADKIDRPRFYLPFMMMPYVYFGYVVLYAQKKIQFPYVVKTLALIGFCVIIFSNVYAVSRWFSELETSQQITTISKDKNIKGKSFWLTWGHFERAANAMNMSCAKQNPIFFFMAKNIQEYDHSIEYALLEKDISAIIGAEKKYSEGGPKGCYYFISLPSEKVPDFVANNQNDTPVNAGGIQVIRFYPKETTGEFTIENNIKKAVFVPEKITRYSRVYWGDVLRLITK